MPVIEQPHNLLLINLSLSAVLCGLIWTIQLVHYPSFLDVGSDEYLIYQRNHMKNISILVGPLMLLELVFGIYLQLQQWQTPIHWSVHIASLLLVVVWLITFIVSSPLHGRLIQGGFDKLAIQKLIDTNWIRTLAWTGRFLIFFFLLLFK
jgi:hypothetical protein